MYIVPRLRNHARESATWKWALREGTWPPRITRLLWGLLTPYTVSLCIFIAGVVAAHSASPHCWRQVLDKCLVSALLHSVQGGQVVICRIWKFLPSHLPFYLPFQFISLWLYVKPSAICVYLSFSIMLPIQNYLFFPQSLSSKISANFS